MEHFEHVKYFLHEHKLHFEDKLLSNKNLLF